MPYTYYHTQRLALHALPNITEEQRTPKYKVTIREIIAHHIEVEASTEGNAQTLAYEQYADYPENHIGVEGVISHTPESEGTESFAYEVSKIVESS